VLLSSGVGAIIGAYVWGWACRPASAARKVFYRHRAQFPPLQTGLLYFTPDNGWIYLSR